MEEYPGYEVVDHARFDVYHRPISETKIEVGEISDQGFTLDTKYYLKLIDLTKHALVVGTTGSGKTNTIFFLLRQLQENGIPFIVIEPVKSEYRKLLHDETFSNVVRIFTLGENNISPLRLNPFEILPGVNVQTHIDILRSLFNASFVMYSPVPYVLDRCLHEIYEDKGWDLSTNINARGTHVNSMPTLTDLYSKVDDVVDRLGYEVRLSMDIKASLKTRINSLRIGSKGLMLDTRKSVPLSFLLERPTILELQYVGDDEEKAFVMGLLFSSVYESYISQGFNEETSLKHITVIEEAHRLAFPCAQISGL